MSKSKTRPVPTPRTPTILESELDLDKLCRDFDVTDEEDIEDIVSGRIGENINW